MATLLGSDSSDPEKGNVFKKIRNRIEEKFGSVIQKVIERRDALLLQLEQWEQEHINVIIDNSNSSKKLKSEKLEMEQLLVAAKGETARNLLISGIDQLTRKIRERDEKTYIPELTFSCETNDLEWRISQLGVFNNSEKTETPPARNYTLISKPLKLFGNFGYLRGEFKSPRGVLVDDAHRRIFIADMQNGRVQVWTMDGEYISVFGKGTLVQPWGIVMCDNFLFISDFDGHFLTKWGSDGFDFKAKSCTRRGSDPGDLTQPTGLDIDEGEVFVVESGNYRISVFDMDLNFKRVMAHKVIKLAFCLRVRNNTIYIMERTGFILLFSKADKLLRTIKKNYNSAGFICHFNFDPQLNFLVTDKDKNTLVFLSLEGELIHSIYFENWELEGPFGVGTTKKGDIIISFQAGNCNVVAVF